MYETRVIIHILPHYSIYSSFFNSYHQTSLHGVSCASCVESIMYAFISIYIYHLSISIRIYAYYPPASFVRKMPHHAAPQCRVWTSLWRPVSSLPCHQPGPKSESRWFHHIHRFKQCQTCQTCQLNWYPLVQIATYSTYSVHLCSRPAAWQSFGQLRSSLGSRHQA